jgi:hypothetical protein
VTDDPAEQLAAVRVRFQPILDRLPPLDDEVGAVDELVAESERWAPYRAEANAWLLRDED